MHRAETVRGVLRGSDRKAPVTTRRKVTGELRTLKNVRVVRREGARKRVSHPKGNTSPCTPPCKVLAQHAFSGSKCMLT